MYAKWFDEFKNYVSTWPANFFENKNDLVSASKIPPNSRLTQLITRHSKFLHFSNRIGKADSPLCLSGLMETCSLLFDCPVYCRVRIVTEFELSEYEIRVPFPISLIIRNNRFRTIVNRFLSRTKRLDF